MIICLQELLFPTTWSMASILEQEIISISEPFILFCSRLLQNLLINSVSHHQLKVNCVEALGTRKDVGSTFHFLCNHSIIACVDTLKGDHSGVFLF